jgi:hypothetical protein
MEITGNKRRSRYGIMFFKEGRPLAGTYNGHQWRVDGDISIDVGLLNRRTRMIWPGNANLLGDPLPVREELHYFRLLYPMQLNLSKIQQTNAVLVRAGRAVINESELLKYYGILLKNIQVSYLNMTLDRKRIDIREYWEETEREGSTFPPQNMASSI